MTKPTNYESTMAAAKQGHGGSSLLLFKLLLTKPQHSVFRQTWSFNFGFFLHFHELSTMPGRGKKSKGSTSSVTAKKRTSTTANKPQSLPISSTPAQELLNDMDMTGHNGET